MKYLSLIIIGLFVISVLPAVVADDETDIRERYGSGLSADEVRKLGSLSRGRIAELPDDLSALKDRLGDIRLRVKSKEDAFRMRYVSESAVERARERLERAQEKYEEARERYESSKEAFRERVRAESASCMDNSTNSTDCEEARDEAVERAKEHLMDLAEMILERLNEIEADIEGNDDLTEEEAEEALAEVSDLRAEIEEAMVMLDEASTKDEVKEAGRAILNAWKEMSEGIKDVGYSSAKARIAGILVRAEHLELRMDRAIELLEEKGVDTSDLDEKLDEFSMKVADARENLRRANALLADARADRNGMNEAAKQVHELLREAHESLKDAHKIMKEFVKMLHEEGEDLPDDDEVVVVEDDEDDSDDDSRMTEEERCVEDEGTWTGTETSDGMTYTCVCREEKVWDGLDCEDESDDDSDDSSDEDTSDSSEAQRLCDATGGTWKEFSNGCADSCFSQRNDNVACTAAITEGCDCGVDMCWSEDGCEGIWSGDDNSTDDKLDDIDEECSEAHNVGGTLYDQCRRCELADADWEKADATYVCDCDEGTWDGQNCVLDRDGNYSRI